MTTEMASRSVLVSIVRKHLGAAGLLRLQMLAIVTATGLSGFFASVILLHWHVRAMWVRYGLCVGLAYAVFFLLLRMWIYHHSHVVPGLESVSDHRDTTEPVQRASTPTGNGALDYLDVFDAFDFGDWPAFLACAIAVASALIACVLVVYTSPVLFAEVLVDFALSMGLYSRLRNQTGPHWAKTVLWRTGIPFAIVALLFMVAGAACQKYAPEAVSIGGVLNHASSYSVH